MESMAVGTALQGDCAEKVSRILCAVLRVTPVSLPTSPSSVALLQIDIPR